jgi:hypothetical protein
LEYLQDSIALMGFSLPQLHGTCLGFEALVVIVSRNGSVLSRFDSYNNPSQLLLTEDGRQGSAFFGSFPQSVLQGLQDQPLAMENHGKGESSARCEV